MTGRGVIAHAEVYFEHACAEKRGEALFQSLLLNQNFQRIDSFINIHA
jgi:hypothetical protein